MGLTNRRKMKLRKELLKKVNTKRAQKATPMQVVKEKFGSKVALSEKVAELVERKEDEEATDFNKRMATMSNSKLLKLYYRGEAIAKSFDSKSAMADAVYKRVRGEKGKVDQDYLNKLNKLSLGRLWDMYRFFKRSK